MPTSNSTFGELTPGYDVVSAYPEEVKDRIILITGANPGGIGASTAISLAKASPKLLIVAGRSPDKLAGTIEQIRIVNPDAAVKPLILDLSSQESCRKAAQEILDADDVPHLDILINNAGVMNIAERTLSPEGIEMQFATNHVGHFLFTNLVIPKLVVASKLSPARPPRIVNVSSRAVLYGPVRFSDWNFTKTEADLPKHEHMSQQPRHLFDEHEDKPYVPQAAYGQSKCANVLFTRELNERLLDKQHILSIAAHPGFIKSNLDRHITKEQLQTAYDRIKAITGGDLSQKDLDQGCSTSLVAALDPKITSNDFFLADCQIADWAPESATSPTQAKQLWALTEGLVRQQFL